MIDSYLPFVIAWAALAVVVIVMAIYRSVIAIHEDDSLHIRDDEAGVVAEQTALGRKLDVLDRWGKILTVVTVATGLALASVYVYSSWVAQNRTAGG